MKTKSPRVAFALLVLSSAGALSCAGEDVPVPPDHVPPDHAMDYEQARTLATIRAPVTCGAKLKKYPVNGKHNGGWDKNALTYTCPPHPAHAKDNSDFIPGDHYGNDIFAAKGTPLVACVDGTITSVANTSIGGKNVTIKDSCGWYYYYAHMDSIASDLHSGKKVSAGHYLGGLGNTGNAVGTSWHLHFSIFPGVYVQGIDPFPLLQAVDAGSCGGTTPPAPTKPEIAIWSDTSAKDVRPEGKSKGIGDTYEGDTFTVNVYVEAKASGAKPNGELKLGYWVETPYLEVVTYTIYTDWPKKDKKTWVVNDSDSAPGNPPKSGTPASGKLNIYAMSPGETKRVKFQLRASKYSIGAVDHPDLRAWVWHVADFYGEMTGFYDDVEVNKAGKLLRTYEQHDVYGQTHWEWNGTGPETEGWTKANAVAAFEVNTTDHCLAVKQGGKDPYFHSPEVSLSAEKWKGFEARVRHHEGKKKGQLFFLTSADGKWTEQKSVVFETIGDGKFHDIAIDTGSNATWKGTVTRLRIDPTPESQQWFDIDWLRAVEKPGPTTGDADADGHVASADCDDTDAAVYPGANEVCDGKDNDCNGEADEKLLNACGKCGPVPEEVCDDKDNDCDGEVDEGFDKGPEVCDGKDNDCDGPIDEGVTNACGKCGPVPEEVCDGVDNDCDGVLPEVEADADGDGQIPCKGDCNDGDPAVHAGAPELCDGKDNDCDGEADEGLDIGAVCTVGKGECKAKGVVHCAETLEPACSAKPGTPQDELCDGKDDDCDGETDNGFGLGEACTNSSPKCERAGVTVCSAGGKKAVCNASPPEPAAETCNYQDDDCDGDTDEGFPLMEECIVGTGKCESPGHWTCAGDGGLWCKAPEVAGMAELCDGEDNDCDGLADEGYPLGEPCKVVEAACSYEGVWVCAPTGIDTECDVATSECIPIAEPPPPPPVVPEDDGPVGPEPAPVAPDLGGRGPDAGGPPGTGDTSEPVSGGPAPGPDAGEAPTAGTEDGGGCAASEGPAHPWALFVLLLVLTLIGRARRSA